MKIRWKFLSFLAVFLLGSFMIVTWKSYSLFSQKYAKSLQMMEVQSLEKQAQYISQQFTTLQKIIRQPESVEPQLKNLGIGLMAHVVNEEGKWKAKWFEGQSGFRKDAAAVTKQIPFESLSSSRKSWHLVQMQEGQRGMAYVIPAVENNKMAFYAFFFTKDFLNKLFKGQSFLENMVAYSPQVGQIYSVGDFDDSVIDKNRSAFKDKQSGVINVSKNASLYFYFHPDLQVYLMKMQNPAVFQVESPFYLVTLFAIVILLIGISLVAMDLLMGHIFNRVRYVTASLRLRVNAETSKDQFADELEELEFITHALEDSGAILTTAKTETATTTTPAPAAEAKPAVVDQLRPKAINSLGYLHRLKAQVPATPHLQMLEKELREMRAIIDPATATAQGLPPAQPYFSPVLDTFKKQNIELESAPRTDSTDVTAGADDVELLEAIPSQAKNEVKPKNKLATKAEAKPGAITEDMTVSEVLREIEAIKAASMTASSVNIRKPKREGGHESNNV